MWNKKILPLVWRLDSFRRPNDGICPWCDHQHDPEFGRFVCEECGGYVCDNPLAQNMLMMSQRQFSRAAIGGVLFAIVIIGLAIGADWLIALLYKK